MPRVPTKKATKKTRSPKRKPGRPAARSGGRQVPLVVFMEKALHARLKKAAKAKGLTLSQWVRQVMGKQVK